MSAEHAIEHEPGSPMTFEAWGDLPEDEPGELVDGELVEEEMPTFLHEVVVGWLIMVLGGWALPRGGLVGGSEGKFKVNARKGRKPDLFVYLPGSRRPSGRDTVLLVPPGIAVEVVSPRPRDVRRDRVEKADEYAEFQVPYYWIVDPFARTLEIWELGADGRYVHAVAAAEGVVDRVPGCEGLSIDLTALWVAVDGIDTKEPGSAPSGEG